MNYTDSCKRQPGLSVRKPTEFLCGDSAQLSLIMIHDLITKGFELKDVRAMVFSSELYLDRSVLRRIIGKPIGALKRKKGLVNFSHLNSLQSGVAYQFAETLEHASRVFGTQKLAEEWLGRPSRFLNGKVPLEMVDNSVGYLALKQYLESIEYGVYQ